MNVEEVARPGDSHQHHKRNVTLDVRKPFGKFLLKRTGILLIWSENLGAAHFTFSLGSFREFKFSENVSKRTGTWLINTEHSWWWRCGWHTRGMLGTFHFSSGLHHQKHDNCVDHDDHRGGKYKDPDVIRMLSWRDPTTIPGIKINFGKVIHLLVFICKTILHSDPNGAGHRDNQWCTIANQIEIQHS